jgi:hypothetical protein
MARSTKEGALFHDGSFGKGGPLLPVDSLLWDGTLHLLGSLLGKVSVKLIG